MSAETWPIADVEAGLGQYLDALEDGQAVRIELSYGTTYARGRRDGIELVETGRGGGLYNRRTVSRRQVEQLLGGDDVEISRPGPARDVWPDRFLGWSG